MIAVGLSNGRIRFYSTWDLTLLREFGINSDSTLSINSNIGCIICLTFTKDRLYVADSYAKIYILESGDSTFISKQNQFVLNQSSSNYITNLICFS